MVDRLVLCAETARHLTVSRHVHAGGGADEHHQQAENSSEMAQACFIQPSIHVAV